MTSLYGLVHVQILVGTLHPAVSFNWKNHCFLPRNLFFFSSLIWQYSFIDYLIECSSEEFTCNSINCLPKEYLCDGKNDCGDYNDERNCGECLLMHLIFLFINLNSLLSFHVFSMLFHQNAPNLSSSVEWDFVSLGTTNAMVLQTALITLMKWVVVSD